MSDAQRIVLDTLGKLHAHGHGLFGYCRRCDRHFDVRCRCRSPRAAPTALCRDHVVAEAVEAPDRIEELRRKAEPTQH